MIELKEAITGVLDGNLNYMPYIRNADHNELKNITSSIEPLNLSKSSLIKILIDLESNRDHSEEIQNWASFIRRGYSKNDNYVEIDPILIEYNEDEEEVMSDIISRLDELGDEIDGDISSEEILLFIEQLNS